MSCFKLSAQEEESEKVLETVKEKGEVNIPYRMHLKKDGTLFYVDISLYAIQLNGKDIVYAVSKDITNSVNTRYELERELLINKTLAQLSNRLILPNLSIKEMASNVFIASLKLSDSELGYVSEIDKVTRENIAHIFSELIGKACGLGKSDKKTVFSYDENEAFSKIFEHVSDMDKPFFSNDFSKHPLFRDLPEEFVSLRNFLLVPVLYNKEVVGQITLANSPTNYTEEHSIAIQRVAELYALAIHRKRNEKERLKMEEELQQSEKMRMIGQLAGGIAHDFNNQLAGIIGNAELSLSDNLNNKSLNKRLNNIITVSRRASDLANQLLAFARKGNYLREIINLNSMVLEIISILERTIDKKITIKKNFETEVLSIEGDPNQIYSAVLNIAINARDALPDGGFISFNTSEVTIDDTSQYKNAEEASPGRYVKLEIADSGTGIEESILDRIFEPFFTTKEQGKGTGMGLSAVMGIVKMSGGIINVSSILGEGTVFTIFLPSKIKVEVLEKKQVFTIPKNKFSGTVLMADDEEMIIEFGEVMLRKFGFNVITASNGKEVLNLYMEHRDSIKFIILDVIMPQMDGEEALQKIIKLDPTSKVLMVTGYAGKHTPKKLKDLGAYDVIKKPFDISEIFSVIETLMKEIE